MKKIGELLNLSDENINLIEEQFSLGHLTTESSSSITAKLSDTCIEDGIELLKKVDLELFADAKKFTAYLHNIAKQIKRCADSNGRVFFVGCGATGRLSLVLEYILSSQKKGIEFIGIMAGGDYALVRPVELFEDSREKAIEQLRNFNIKSNDYVLGITEGGETTFVIEAVEYALSLGADSAICYCNSDKQLIHINRCRQFIENNKIEKYCLEIGPMAISGSTRMQAATVQMLLVGEAAMNFDQTQQQREKSYLNLIAHLEKLDYTEIKDFVIQESDALACSQGLDYIVDPKLAITVLTDTAERSPTFSLAPFETIHESYMAPVFLSVMNTFDSEQAWSSLLNRPLRGVEEAGFGDEKILSIDLSLKSHERRQRPAFKIYCSQDRYQAHWELGHSHSWSESPNFWAMHLEQKLLLNSLSVLVMVKMGRIQGNIMTYVRPSNYKLVERACRYAVSLSDERLSKTDAYKIIRELYPVPNESIVKKILTTTH